MTGGCVTRRHTTIPGLTACTGGTADAAGDPWLSTGVDGTAYLTGVAATFSPEGRIAEIVASHSNDRGRSWAEVVTVAPPDLRNDKPAITADPRVPGRAYVSWGQLGHAVQLPLREPPRVRAHGRRWCDLVRASRHRRAATERGGSLQRGARSAGGSLLAVFERIKIAFNLTATEVFFATRSVDGGDTWLPPAEIGSMPIVPLSDPETGEPLPQPGFLSAASGRDGDVYVVWEHQRSPTSATIDVARSQDGGLTWSVAPLPGVSAFAFEPTVAVDSRGTVGVTWYDLRNDVPGDAALSADYWFAHSDDAGDSWRQTHVAGPTDLRTAPLAAHNRVGEYQGLAAFRTGFAAAFTLAAPQAKHGPTDIFFARIVPSERHDDD